MRRYLTRDFCFNWYTSNLLLLLCQHGHCSVQIVFLRLQLLQEFKCASIIKRSDGRRTIQSRITDTPFPNGYVLRILTKGCGSPDHSSFTKFSTSRCDTLGCFPFGLLLFVILSQLLLRREGEAMRDEGCDDVYYQRQ